MSEHIQCLLSSSARDADNQHQQITAPVKSVRGSIAAQETVSRLTINPLERNTSARAPWDDSSRSPPLCGGIAHRRASAAAQPLSLIHFTASRVVRVRFSEDGGKQRLRFHLTASATSPARHGGSHRQQEHVLQQVELWQVGELPP